MNQEYNLNVFSYKRQALTGLLLTIAFTVFGFLIFADKLDIILSMVVIIVVLVAIIIAINNNRGIINVKMDEKGFKIVWVEHFFYTTATI